MHANPEWIRDGPKVGGSPFYQRATLQERVSVCGEGSPSTDSWVVRLATSQYESATSDFSVDQAIDTSEAQPRRLREPLSHVRVRHFPYQTDEVEGARPGMVEWMQLTHCQLEMSEESYPLAVSCLDCYLRNQPISLARLQMLAATCLLVASKCKGATPVKEEDLMDCMGFSELESHPREVVKEAMYRQEGELVGVLNEEPALPILHACVRRYLASCEYDVTGPIASYCHYLCELATYSAELHSTCPSRLAAGIVVAARLELREADPFLMVMKGEEGLSLAKVLPVARGLRRLAKRPVCETIDGEIFTVFPAKKYASDERFRVSVSGLASYAKQKSPMVRKRRLEEDSDAEGVASSQPARKAARGSYGTKIFCLEFGEKMKSGIQSLMGRIREFVGFR